MFPKPSESVGGWLVLGLSGADGRSAARCKRRCIPHTHRRGDRMYVVLSLHRYLLGERESADGRHCDARHPPEDAPWNHVWGRLLGASLSAAGILLDHQPSITSPQPRSREKIWCTQRSSFRLSPRRETRESQVCVPPCPNQNIGLLGSQVGYAEQFRVDYIHSRHYFFRMGLTAVCT